MTGDDGLLTDIVSVTPCQIKLPNEQFTWATKQGTLNLGGKLVLHNVYFASHLTITLISVAQLLSDIAEFVVFTKKFCVIQDQSSKTLIGAGEARNGVYHYTGALEVEAGLGARLQPRDLWHQRMGHPSSKVLSYLSDVGSFKNKVGLSEKSCDICIRAKHTRDVFNESSNKAEAPFSLIHCDLWGPYRTRASCGSHYFLTIVDDHTRAVWTILLLEKSEVATTLKNFIMFVERQFEKRVKIIRSDNGTEFICLKEYFKELGIIHQTSCVATPQQNGRVERKHRHILNVARALLFQASLPIRFWGEAILAATYLINRTPSILLDGKTPYELLYGTQPDYSQIRVFGSLCFAKRVARDNDKFGERSVRCLFLGYEFGKKGWIVFDIEKEVKFISRDVIFQEKQFPFADQNKKCETKDETEDDVLLDGETSQTGGVVANQPAFAESDRESSVVEAVVESDQESPEIEQVAESDQEPPKESTSEPIPELIEDENRGVQAETDPQATENRGDGPIDVEESEHEVSVAVPEELGRGKRQRQKSVLLKQFELYSAQKAQEPHCVSPPSTSKSSSKCTYPLVIYVSCERFSPAQQAFLASVCSHEEPSTYDEAVEHEVWRGAVSFEIDVLQVNDTWDITVLPPGKKAIGCKWVFKIKYNSDGSIERYKARLVALGNRQKEGIDFKETFAPVVKLTTVRILLEVASAKNWELHQMDVHNAFLHGDLEEEVYMKLPPGVETSGKNLVCRLKKSLYGLRQAPRCWFAKLSEALKGFGFEQNYSDYSLFTYNNGESVMYVLVYVDDLVIGGNDSSLISKFKSYLSECFKMKDLGPLKYFLGLEISRGEDGIYVCQRKYALDIISECGLLGARPAATPLEQNHRLVNDKSAFYSDPEQYRRLVGRLVYLSITRPELSYVVHILAQFMKSPRRRHWEAALRVVRYLKGSPGQGILLSSKSDLSLSVYCDSDWAACPLTRKSLTGYVVMLGTSLVSWKTKKQSTVSSSSAEAEYRAMAYTCRELIWVMALLKSLGVVQSGAIPFYCDNKAAIQISSNPVCHERTKHIEVDCHIVRNAVRDGIISTKYVKTTDQLADILTKALGRDQFGYLLRKLGVRDLHAPA